MKPTKTSAERTRELSILSDPLANLLSPDYVECKQCRKKIKLSSKSAYDTFHWRNHRKRCIKSYKKKGKQPQPSPATVCRLSTPMMDNHLTWFSPASPFPIYLSHNPLEDYEAAGGVINTCVKEPKDTAFNLGQ